MTIGDKVLMRYFRNGRTIYEVLEIKTQQDREYILNNEKYFIMVQNSKGNFGKLDKLVNPYSNS